MEVDSAHVGISWVTMLDVFAPLDGTSSLAASGTSLRRKLNSGPEPSPTDRSIEHHEVLLEIGYEISAMTARAVQQVVDVFSNVEKQAAFLNQFQKKQNEEWASRPMYAETEWGTERGEVLLVSTPKMRGVRGAVVVQPEAQVDGEEEEVNDWWDPVPFRRSDVDEISFWSPVAFVDDVFGGVSGGVSMKGARGGVGIVVSFALVMFSVF